MGKVGGAGGLGSTPTDDKYLLSPEEQDRSGSSVRFLAGVELSHNGGKESVKYCKACVSETAHNTAGCHAAVVVLFARGHPQFPIPSTRRVDRRDELRKVRLGSLHN